MNIDELEKILEIIQPLPSTRVGYFAANDSIELESVYRYTESKELEFELLCVDQDFYSRVNSKYKSSLNFSLDRKSYMRQGKFYDYLFVDIEIQDIDSFLKKSHKSIKNGGLIMIFLDNSSRGLLDKYIELLENNYYVATSKIDIDSSNLLLISKKMHGWGG